MKTTTISAAIAFATLAGIGSAVLADSPHDGYYRGFYGSVPDNAGTTASPPETTGKAAYGTPSSTSLRDGNDTYKRAFSGDSPSPKGRQIDMMANPSSGPDGNTIYHRAFNGE